MPWSQATFVYFTTAPPPRCPTPTLVACRCCPPCPPMPLPLRPCPPLPVSPLALAAAVGDDRYCRCQQPPQFCRTVNDNNHQKPADIVHHWWRQCRSSSTAAAVNGCGGDGIFAAAVNNHDLRHRLHPTATSVDDDHCQQRLPMQPSMTMIESSCKIGRQLFLSIWLSM